MPRTLIVPGVSVEARFDVPPPLPARSGILGAVGVVDRIPAAVTYGTGPDADWRVTDIRHESGSVRFTVAHDGDEVSVEVPKPGRHIALNATGVLSLIGEAGLSVEAAASRA